MKIELSVLFKEEVYAFCLDTLSRKITALRDLLQDLSTGMRNDSKSTAGDKHETAQAMAQLEQEKIGRQLKELLEQKTVLESTDIQIHAPHVIKGSLVKTDSACFFMSIPLGKILLKEESIIVLSPQSPLGLKLMGMRAGESTNINGLNYVIESIL